MRSNWLPLLTLHIVTGLIPTGDQWGTEFLLSFMKNGHGNGNPYLIILTIDTASVNITNHWTSSTTTHMVAGGVSLKFELAQEMRYTAATEQPEFKTVTLRSDINVTVYVMDHNTYSAEGYLAIPLRYLSTRYIAVSYTETDYFPAVQVSAVYDNTEVSLKFNIADGGTCGVGLHLDGAKMSLKLQSRETVTIFCTHDLTGTYISSSQPVSVLSGHPCANVPARIGGIDMLIEMIVPIEALGTNFLLHNLIGRDSGAIYRVVASEDNTTFTTTTGKSGTLQFGEFNDFDTLEDGEMCMSADKPVLLVMYGKSKQADTVVTVGDGFMSQVPPVDRFLQRYLFDASVIPDFTSYIAKTLHKDLLVPTRDTGFTQPFGCNFSVDVRESPSSFTSLTLGTDLFGAVAYGFMPTGGYGFPLGIVFDFDDCESSPCENGGTCIDHAYIYTCLCEPDYTGSTCESVLTPSTTDALRSSSRSSSFDVLHASTTDELSTTEIESPSYSSHPSSLSSPLLPAISTNIAADISSRETSFSKSFSASDASQSTADLETTPSYHLPSLAALPSSMLETDLLSDLVLTIPLSVESVLSSTSVFIEDWSLSTDSNPVETLSSTPSLLDELTSLANSLSTPSTVSISTSPASTHIIDLLSPSASSAEVNTSLCVCGCAVKLSSAEVQAYTKMIKKTLTVSTHNLSSTLRRRTSIPDNRPSAVAVGFSGIIVIVITTLLFICTDFISLARHVFGKSKLPQTARLTLRVTRSDSENFNID